MFANNNNTGAGAGAVEVFCSKAAQRLRPHSGFSAT